MSMQTLTRKLAALSVLGVLTAPAAMAASPPQQTAHLRSQLVAADMTASPGRTLQLGLLFEHDEHWHTYWRNPGDSGLKTEVELALPDGVQFLGIDWPAPERFVLSPEITNFGYSGRTLLPMRLTVPTNYSADSLPIRLKARWLICEHECIPGRAEYALSLPVQRAGNVTVDSRWVADFARSAARQPQVASIEASIASTEQGVLLNLAGDATPSDLKNWNLFPVAEELIDYGTLPNWQLRGSQWQTALKRSDYFTALPERSEWLLVKGDQALMFTATAKSADD